jgi:hypothetical protein
MFFRSSSPLRDEAENWFLSELRGRYDVLLKHIARHPGCTHGDVVDHVRSVGTQSAEQIGGYLDVLIRQYEMVERRLPVFAKPSAKLGRYYLRDNFLRSWLAALANPVAALSFRPEAELVAQADRRLVDAEGHGLERLAGVLYEERSRKGIGDFAMTERIQGYWDRRDVEIDLVAVDEDSRRIRFGTCKRSPTKLLRDLDNCSGHIERFFEAHAGYRGWEIERVAIAPTLDPKARAAIEAKGFLAQDLGDLTAGL